MLNGVANTNESVEDYVEVQLPEVESAVVEESPGLQEGLSVKGKEMLTPDPLGIMEIGQVISEEGHVFKGVDSEGDAVLHRVISFDQVEEVRASLSGLHAGFNEYDTQAKNVNKETPPEEILAVAVDAEVIPIDFNRITEELEHIINDDKRAERVIGDSKSNPNRKKYSEEYFRSDERKKRLTHIASTLGVTEEDPNTLLQKVFSLERDAKPEKTTPEGEHASLVVESSHAEKIATMIARGEHPPYSLLQKYKLQLEVRDYLREKLLSAITDNDTAILSSIPDWVFQIWKNNPKVKTYLGEQLFSGEKKERPTKETAMDQLIAKQELETAHNAGLDDPAPFAMRRQLKEEGIMVPKEKVLLTHEVLELLRKSRGNKGTKEIGEIVESTNVPNELLVRIPKKPIVETYQDPLNKYWDNDASAQAVIAIKEKEGKLNFNLAENNTPTSELELVPIVATSTMSQEIQETPIVDVTESRVSNTEEGVPQSPINFAVAKQYQEKFGLDESALEAISGFTKLSIGQQLLLMRNMESEVLRDVNTTAKAEQKEEWQSHSLWGKIWRGGLTMGAYQFARTKTIEKELLVAARGKGESDDKMIEMRAEHLANIEEYTKVVGQGPDVEVHEDGTLEIMYVSQKEFFDSLEDKKISSENLHIIERFNLVASEFAKLPREWGYEPRDEKSTAEHKHYETNKSTYASAREDMLQLYTEKYKEKGVENPERSAMLAMHALDERMQTNQLFNAHPDAEEALANIEDQSAMMAGVREFWRDKGRYIALGAGVRIAAGAVSGALTGGLGLLLATGGVGSGVGYLQGQREAKKLIRERRIDRRMSEEDEREEITYRGGDIDAQGQFIPAQTRKIKEFTDATFFIDRIERLTTALEQSTDSNERSLLESKIAKTNAVMEGKYRRGLINFGGSSLKEGDTRKGNDIANRLSFMQAMGSAALIEVVDPKQLTSEIDRIIGEHQEKIESVREGEIKSTAQKAAALRGAFSLSGAYIAGVIRDSAVVDAIFTHQAVAPEADTTATLLPNEKIVSVVEETPTPVVAPAHAVIHETVIEKHEAFKLPTPVESAVSYDKAHLLAEKYVSEDMMKLRQEWLLLHDDDAQNILAYTRENVGQRNGALDSWPSIARVQEYIKAQGFTKEAGYTPQEGESLEQFLVRAHTIHLMKEGVVVRPEVVSASEPHLPQPVEPSKTPSVEVPKAVEVKPEVVAPVKEISSDRVLPDTKEAIPQTTKVYTPPPYVERSVPSSVETDSTPTGSSVYKERELPPL